ncbi:MAG: hypothetical protein K1060chlam2_01517 [Chlamydiae bacterium]|nr:hypothetical protein [Chlamydiota bacterium]
MGSIQNSTYIKAISYGALALITSRFLPGSSSLFGRLGAAGLAAGITFANDYFIDDQKDWSKTLLKAGFLLGWTAVGANVAVKLLKGRVTLSPRAAAVFSAYATVSSSLISLAMKSDPLKREYDDFKANPEKLLDLDMVEKTRLFDTWYSEDFDRFSLIGVDISEITSRYVPLKLEKLAEDTREKLDDITTAKLGWRRELLLSHLEKILWRIRSPVLLGDLCTIK